MSIKEEIEADVAEIFAAFGDEIEIRGARIRALVSEPEIQTEPVPGGYGEDGDISVKLLRGDIPGGPVRHGEPIRYAGRDYRVVRVMDRPSRPLVVLTAEPSDG